MSIELEAKVRNVVALFENCASFPKRNNVRLLSSKSTLSDTGNSCNDEHPKKTTNKNAGGLWNGNSGIRASYSGAFFDRIQIRPQLRSRDAGSALDIEDPQRRNFIPLRDSLFGNAK